LVKTKEQGGLIINSEQFKQARLNLDLTQVELGKLMGLKQYNISKIETGKHEPTKQQAAHIGNLRKWKDKEEFGL